MKTRKNKSEAKKTLNDISWETIFKELHILDRLADNETVRISSEEINKHREARLMTKIDHRSQLPRIFADNNLAILPVTRGTYEIGRFEIFSNLEEHDAETIPIDFPSYVKSLDHKNICSESLAINCAFVSKMLSKFIGDEFENLLPTVCGRMSSSSFDFNINAGQDKVLIKVNNSQLEIDGGFEDDRSLILIEAKNYISDDFVIRQLYYPYRLWSDKIIKPIRPIFLTYSNGIFHLREYEFTDQNLYNSISLVKHTKYVFREEEEINTETIQNIIDTIKVVKEPGVPFPQADNFNKIINLCELMMEKGLLTKEDITLSYDFTPRQTDYYLNAAKYLGLVRDLTRKRGSGFTLSNTGENILGLPIIERQIGFVKLILSHQVFKKTLELYFETGSNPSTEEVVEFMRSVFSAKDSTLERRAQTVLSWINWILSLI